MTSPSSKQRCSELNIKRRTGVLTDAEHEELLELIEQIEAAQVERLAHLAELAHLRGMSLPKLMDDLGLEPPPVE